MLTNSYLFELYKSEKELSSDNGYGDVKFKSFKDWKVEYITEYKKTHLEMSEEEINSYIKSCLGEVASLESDVD